jgi:NAD(P)-dependent dehydrogenase (short-subunit alcohol dehydrogenase family)
MKLLEGKVGIVTGGAKGLGHGISRRMAREGASLLITGRDGAATEKVAAEIRDEFGTQAIGISADVGIKEQIEAMVERAVSEFGGLDILVNNASQLSPNILLEHKTDEMLKRTLEIGTWGTWWAMRAAFPHMKARGGGAIVNFYSIDAQTGAWLHSDYNMNKGAILGLTRSAAVEWGRFNIRTNAIAPTGLGQVFAQLVNDVPGFLEMATASNPLKRAGDPENDIGPVVVFLASDMASFVNGELINVDGGQHLPGYVSVPHNLDELEAQS